MIVLPAFAVWKSDQCSTFQRKVGIFLSGYMSI